MEDTYQQLFKKLMMEDTYLQGDLKHVYIGEIEGKR